MRRLSVCSLFVLMLALSPAVMAQSAVGTLSGTVADESGAAIPGVTVTATNHATGVVRTTVTNAAGSFTFPLLSPATYDVDAELSGFQPLKRSGVTVHIG